MVAVAFAASHAKKGSKGEEEIKEFVVNVSYSTYFYENLELDLIKLFQSCFNILFICSVGTVIIIARDLLLIETLHKMTLVG